MDIGIVVEDSGYSKMGFKNPEYGNPGVSGTVFEFLMLIRYLCMASSDREVMVFHFGDNAYPDKCRSIKCNSHSDVVQYAKKQDVLLIVQNGLNVAFYEKLNTESIKTVLWAHNYITGEDAERFSSMANIQRVVFVGREQYDHYIAHDIINKSTFIFNMFDSEQKTYYRNLKLKPIVTYTGSLIPAKGFHMLAHVWKDVLKKVPEAQLNVLGSGKLYDRRAMLGKYGIAEENYENSFISSLVDERNAILPSVHFWGVIGEEKVNIYHETMVGVMNPTGASETFGLSGVEMEACGIPIVTKKKYGLLDTVENKKTGFLINNEKELLTAIVKLLKDRELNEVMGQNAKAFVSTRFSPNKIIKQWIQMFEDIESGKGAVYCKPDSNFKNDWKWLLLLNRKCREIIPAFPSIIGYRTRKREKGKISR